MDLLDILKRLTARVAQLEASAPRILVAVVTDTSPLSVAVAGAAAPHVDVKTLAGQTYTEGDRVAVAVSSADLLVLGVIE